MTYSILPLRLPGSRALTRPLTRPFNIDPDCVMALLPEINTKWLDQSNNTNHGVKSGDPTIIPGRIHQALHFDGVGDFITVSNHASIVFATGDFSLVVWLRTTDDGNSNLILKGAAAPYFYLRLLNTGRVRIMINDDATNVFKDTTKTVNDGSWHQIIATIDRDDVMKIYIDGVYQVTSADISGIGDVTSADNMLIVDDAQTGHFYVGDLDEILIFNRVLEAWEVTALYNQGAP